MPRLDAYPDVIRPWWCIGKPHMEMALGQLAADGHGFQVSGRPRKTPRVIANQAA